MIDLGEEIDGHEWWLCCSAPTRRAYLIFNTLENSVLWMEMNIEYAGIVLARTANLADFKSVCLVNSGISRQKNLPNRWTNLNHG